ncbi:hypothetical protein [Telmatospirillum siberiense]|uniref:Uncharacterized protein n=1 Tax=Telmatospirillum siberiense TaxID=382514 RepID=A0A2N3PNF0_9PROT|nr:hypothetical protein [Telmatospirillum siberiense]PKU21925.1 hypothetical protein CWS72_24370 [Telmatospirillum siberiense]
MQDDFSALDLLSIGGFRLSSAPLPPVEKKKRFVGYRHKPKAHAKRGLASFLPLLGRKLRRPSHFRVLEGWPVSLSWPTKEFSTPDLSVDLPERTVY